MKPFADVHLCKMPPFKLSLLACLIPGLMFVHPVLARDYFNPSAIDLRNGGQAADLSSFAETGGQAPGVYHVNIYVNGEQAETRDVNFVSEEGKLRPELTLAQLKQWGVQVALFPELVSLKDDAVITQPGKYIPQADTSLNFSQQRLDISVPQAAMGNQVRGYVDPSQWDHGVPALLLNYTYSGSQTDYKRQSGTYESNFLNLRSGANFGPWRLRNYSTWSSTSNTGSKWNSVNSYLQRDIQSLRAQLTMGDSNTPGEVFDSVQFRGVQLASDDNQLPDSQRGFAPIIRGIAQSNAQVTVRQNGYIIYQSYVPPGAFAINDLYPTGSQGNLDVTIREADGREQRFVQPYSSLPIMQREGQLKYGVVGGKYRSSVSGSREMEFGQLSLIYGLPANTTLYGGVIGAGDYQSAAIGIGHGFGELGSVSADVTQSRTKMRDDSKEQGQSYRIQYSKDIAETGTNFTLAGYRYSTNGFYDFQEANEMVPNGEPGTFWYGHKRSRTQLNITQTLGDYGSFYLSGYDQRYWGQSGSERNLAVGYSVNMWNMTWGLNYTWTRPADKGPDNQQLAFSLSIPLGQWLPNANAYYSVTTDKQHKTVQQAGLSGTALANNNLNYSISQGYTNKGEGNSGYATADYKGTYGEVTGGYNYSQDTRQVNYGLAGGVIVHPYGVTLSQPLGDTVALVRAPGASGTLVENHSGVKTDWRGYAVVPYVSAYKRNRVALDTQTLAENVDVDLKTQNVVPTQGAVVVADFKTRVGSRVLMTLLFGGKPLPFGALVTLDGEEGSGTGIVGDGGQVYLSGVPDKGSLVAKWGNGNGRTCRADFVLPPQKKDESSLRYLDNVACR